MTTTGGGAPGGGGDALSGGVILAIDTATSRVVLGLAGADGTAIGGSTWIAGHRHGETLLPAIERLLDDVALTSTDLTGIAVGTGPGTFTGLRVGIATAKGLAHGLGIPIVGISTAEALLEAARADPTVEPGVALALLLPAGPQDRLLIHGTSTTILPPGADVDLAETTRLIAVDLAGRAPDDAVLRGESAVRGFAAALLALGIRRLARGDADDLASLVPEYVTLPRGVTRQTGEVEWSRDPR